MSVVNASVRGPTPTQPALTATFALYVLPLVVGVAGNAGIMYIIAATKPLHTSVNAYIANMAALDLLACTLLVPLRIAFYVLDIDLLTARNAFCRADVFFRSVTDAGRVILLAAVSFERYQTVARPFQRDKTAAARRAFLTLAVIWLLVVGSAAMLTAFFHDTIMFEFCSLGQTALVYSLWGNIEVYVVLPLSVLSVGIVLICYLLMFRLLYEQRQKMNKHAVKATKATSKVAPAPDPPPSVAVKPTQQKYSQQKSSRTNAQSDNSLHETCKQLTSKDKDQNKFRQYTALEDTSGKLTPKNSRQMNSTQHSLTQRDEIIAIENSSQSRHVVIGTVASALNNTQTVEHCGNSTDSSATPGAVNCAGDTTPFDEMQAMISKAYTTDTVVGISISSVASAPLAQMGQSDLETQPSQNDIISNHMYRYTLTPVLEVISDRELTSSDKPGESHTHFVSVGTNLPLEVNSAETGGENINPGPSSQMHEPAEINSSVSNVTETQTAEANNVNAKGKLVTMTSSTAVTRPHGEQSFEDKTPVRIVLVSDRPGERKLPSTHLESGFTSSLKIATLKGSEASTHSSGHTKGFEHSVHKTRTANAEKGTKNVLSPAYSSRNNRGPHSQDELGATYVEESGENDTYSALNVDTFHSEEDGRQRVADSTNDGKSRTTSAKEGWQNVAVPAEHDSTHLPESQQLLSVNTSTSTTSASTLVTTLSVSDPTANSSSQLPGKTDLPSAAFTKIVKVVEMDGTVHTEHLGNNVQGAVCMLNPRNKLQGRRRVEIRVAKRLVVLFLSFLLLWLPFPCAVLTVRLLHLHPHSHQPWSVGVQQGVTDLLAVLSALTTVTAAVNPVFYGLANGNIRSAVKIKLHALFAWFRGKH